MMIFFTHTHNTILNLEEISSLEESNSYLILDYSSFVSILLKKN
jgi:hypothetical protein